MITSVIQAGLGNQLFQYACAYSLAKKWETQLVLDISFFDYFKKGNPYNLREFELDKLTIESYSIINNPNKYWKYKLISKYENYLLKRILGLNNLIVEDFDKCREFQESKILSANQNSTIYGFWQNTNYFDIYINDLRRMFRPSYTLNDGVNEVIEDIERGVSVGVHVRRGDFVNLGWDKGECYYTEAINTMCNTLSNPRFYLVSDDPEWCRTTFQRMYNVFVIDIQSEHKNIDEFFILSCCKHQIISESTFGWWAAYLNGFDNKIIMIPDNAEGEIFTSLPNAVKIKS